MVANYGSLDGAKLEMTKNTGQKTPGLSQQMHPFFTILRILGLDAAHYTESSNHFASLFFFYLRPQGHVRRRHVVLVDVYIWPMVAAVSLYLLLNIRLQPLARGQRIIEVRPAQLGERALLLGSGVWRPRDTAGVADALLGEIVLLPDSQQPLGF